MKKERGVGGDVMMANNPEDGIDTKLSGQDKENRIATASSIKTEEGEIMEGLMSTLTPDNADTSPSSQLSTKMNNLTSRGVRDRRSSHGLKSPGGNDWVHDRFEAISHDFRTPTSRSDIDSYRPADSAHRNVQDDMWRPAEKVDNSGRLSPLELKKPPSSADTAQTRRYVSCEEDIWEKARRYHFSTRHVVETFMEKRAFVKSAHPTKSHDWLRWATEKAVWARFCECSIAQPFYSFANITDRNQVSKSSTPFPGLEPRDEENSFIRPVPGIRYVHREKEMEEMARKKGIRSEFFRFLQRARDHVRAIHHDCDSEVRHFMADEMTWTNFFCKSSQPRFARIA